MYRDYLGSIVMLTDEDGNIAERRHFDPWGQSIKVEESAGKVLQGLTLLDRGFTGHAHLQTVGLIHMNGRLYDPALHRFLQPDNYVQDPFNTQNFNRYGYCLNNPLVYVDKNGEFLWAAVIIGAIFGAYTGGTLANNGEANPLKWNFSDNWGYIIGGTIVGAISGYIGGSLAGLQIPMANTIGIMGGSLVNSIGTWGYTEGKTEISISFGAASFNFNRGSFGYLFKKGNSTLENIGYGLGALANLSDLLAGFNKGDVQLNTEKSDAIGHSAITEVGETDVSSSYVSVGPSPGGKWIFNPFKFKDGTNHWSNYVNAGDNVIKNIVKGVNIDRISSYGNMLSQGVKYNLYFGSCVNHAARALTIAGAPALGIHPFILSAQMYLRDLGIRPVLFGHFFTNNTNQNLKNRDFYR